MRPLEEIWKDLDSIERRMHARPDGGTQDALQSARFCLFQEFNEWIQPNTNSKPDDNQT